MTGILLAILIAATVAGPAIHVTSVSPPNQATAVDPSSAITIEFDQPLDPATVHAGSVRVFGRWSGPSAGVFTLEADDTRMRFTPARPFFAGESVTVSVSSAPRARSGDALETGYAWTFFVRTLTGSLDQRERERIDVRQAGEEWIQTYGAYAGDLNRDGWSDLAVVNEEGDNVRLYINDQKGTFYETSTYSFESGTLPSPNEAADFNGDGFIDLAVGGVGSDRLHVLLGDSSGGFLPPSVYQAGAGVRCVAVLDIDADGDDDLVTANRTSSTLSIFLNDGAGRFADAIHQDVPIDGETSCAVADANGDGMLDLFLGGFQDGRVTLLPGDGRGGFLEGERISVPGRPWMLAAGDLDLDGHADVVSANFDDHSLSVLFGDGRGGFRSIESYPTGELPSSSSSSGVHRMGGL